MRALRTFTVTPRLPESLVALETIARNLRWSWDERTRNLFRWVDADQWEQLRHDPVALIAAAPAGRLSELAGDPGFMSELASVEADLNRYLSMPRWFSTRPNSPLRSVAYFSPEFGISEALPQYSGGLGILAGDHLKAASDLAVPLVGVGLLYRQGYFRQGLNADGWQQERFPDLDPFAMALTLVDGLRITVDLAGTTLHAQVWRADVGRTKLFLLDADIEPNGPAERAVTDRLYGGDSEHRLRQEILLGMGGVRMLHALGIEAQVFHSNEGHAGFAGLERIRDFIRNDHLSFDEAIEMARAGTVFTTHTPVPAGIDRFTRELITKYFLGWANDCGIDLPRLYALGSRSDEPTEDRFNMAVMGLRLSARSNGVAKLHGEVSRQMFSGLWPDVSSSETPIGSVTNGVHAPTWVNDDLAELFGRSLRPDWDAGDPEVWKRADSLSDDELWRIKSKHRELLIADVRRRLRASLERRGQSPSESAWADEVLDPNALTIGFARRFATYKRANLLLSQRDRLLALLNSTDRPIQFVFAGKAHPADNPGKEMIQSIVQFAADADVRNRFVFLDDYDMAMARSLYHGTDVWLNNPRRPLEACGTSGMKAALNGSLNCSILDGWWDECFDGSNGWAISSAEDQADVATRDRIEANSLFELLEHQIVPMFHDRSEGRLPRKWLARMKHNFVSLAPFLTAQRMVRDYVTELYEPAGALADAAARDGFAGAKALSAWKQHVNAQWGGVQVLSVDGETGATDLDAMRTVTAVVSAGSLSPDELAVEVVHGPVGASDELVGATTAVMDLLSNNDGHLHYSAIIPCTAAGRYGYTVRVLPTHPGLANRVELGRATFAS
jgi:glycogen phosphorylase